ncbi:MULTISPECIES: hypothetical protein [unclassified Enterococcus]|uniref:hypothetical protein n=1 Tax=unclassified Enterococcus TaxID=2608891 RepID=UPI00042601D5
MPKDDFLDKLAKEKDLGEDFKKIDELAEKEGLDMPKKEDSDGPENTVTDIEKKLDDLTKDLPPRFPSDRNHSV